MKLWLSIKKKHIVSMIRSRHHHPENLNQKSRLEDILTVEVKCVHLEILIMIKFLIHQIILKT